MSKRVEVFVRIRAGEEGAVWRAGEGRVYRVDSKEETCFDGYDGVFYTENNREVYQKSIKVLVDKFLNEENSTVFAYGQTGAGKTYTILGEGEDGIIHHCLRDILKKEAVYVSYLEIYNEKVYDLSTTHELQIYTIDNIPTVSKLSSTPISSQQSLSDYLKMCEANRKYGSTEFNLRSSRSHTVFQVKNKSNTLNLIDLAGSEKASRNENRRKEGGFINRSLLALCNLVTNLQKNKHFGYRDSKLTRILQPSLDGKTNIVALCMITPRRDCVEESIATLKFGGRLSNLEIMITTKPKPIEEEEEEVLIKIYKTEMKHGYYKEQFLKHFPMEDKDKESEIDFYKIPQEEQFKKERLLLLERISNLEKMVIEMLKKHPSKRTKEIFILEKHMFNLKIRKYKEE